MSNWLSKGIRLYEHRPLNSRDRSIIRRCYNFEQGLNKIAALFHGYAPIKILAIGSESGAAVMHYKWAL